MTAQVLCSIVSHVIILIHDYQKKPATAHIQENGGAHGDREEIIHHDQLNHITDGSHSEGSHEEEVEISYLLRICYQLSATTLHALIKTNLVFVTRIIFLYGVGCWEADSVVVYQFT